jgi:hypothetical protein
MRVYIDEVVAGAVSEVGGHVGGILSTMWGSLVLPSARQRGGAAMISVAIGCQLTSPNRFRTTRPNGWSPKCVAKA